MLFHQFLRKKRNEAKFSQNQVAVWLGFAHRSNVHRKEAGRMNWTVNDLFLMAELFNLKPSELLAEYERNSDL